MRRVAYGAAAVDRAALAYAWPRVAARLAGVYASVAGQSATATAVA
jgi:hypothetical protein